MGNYKFYQHKKCEFFSCHKGVAEDRFSCSFCYCPLYHLEDCGGNYTMLDDGIKDCTNCTIPHKKENYDYVINNLNEG